MTCTVNGQVSRSVQIGQQIPFAGEDPVEPGGPVTRNPVNAATTTWSVVKEMYQVPLP